MSLHVVAMSISSYTCSRMKRSSFKAVGDFLQYQEWVWWYFVSWVKAKKKQKIHLFILHSPWVCLSALPLLFKLKARNPQDIEEAVAHRIGNAVVHTTKTMAKPGGKKKRPRTNGSLVKIDKIDFEYNLNLTTLRWVVGGVIYWSQEFHWRCCMLGILIQC